ncbi:MAG: AAA family ATPase, partial [Deltaproteobacteria bacterium]|nr:AAA family ATPase [Deltaproteobacteria bacterium]
MLTHISISNLATIQSLSMEIKPGFTVLTGETGAGKSILIDALRMVLGGRTSGHLVRSGSPQAVVEAVFDIASLPEVRGRLEEIGIPSGGDLVIRRLILNNGKNRALANDCAITQSKLEDVGKYLVNIHGQHDNQMLLDTKSHIYFLDGFGQLGELRGEVSQSFRQYTDLSREKKELLEQSARREARIQELKDTLEELTLAGLKHDEEGELLHEHTLLTHSEKLAQHITSIQVGLYEGEDSVISRLGHISQVLQQAAGIDQTLEPMAAQLAPMGYQLEDIYRSLSQYGGRLEADPARLDFVNNRLALIERMKRRYGGSVESALAELARGGEELSRLENLESSMDELDRKISQVAGCLHSFSQELSARRHQAAAEMDRLV